ncbi:predicted protein [Naegleria gruberi]|uniref:Predicted protein n=1 Tax=Naegleria gruberi TaxID=5762 RepID=D2V401_NAEGR|nr:uncharacterized protein NAEGRDRAFT_46516 [Naegleria gruberi]EFC48438.1 predicted protein [Naegleria gruberi]|eukprot:XP_002681182.1 predicted protein [Naegleria gruberi strain NEG-M]
MMNKSNSNLRIEVQFFDISYEEITNKLKQGSIDVKLFLDNDGNVSGVVDKGNMYSLFVKNEPFQITSSPILINKAHVKPCIPKIIEQDKQLSELFKKKSLVELKKELRNRFPNNVLPGAKFPYSLEELFFNQIDKYYDWKDGDWKKSEYRNIPFFVGNSGKYKECTISDDTIIDEKPYPTWPSQVLAEIVSSNFFKKHSVGIYKPNSIYFIVSKRLPILYVGKSGQGVKDRFCTSFYCHIRKMEWNKLNYHCGVSSDFVFGMMEPKEICVVAFDAESIFNYVKSEYDDDGHILAKQVNRIVE